MNAKKLVAIILIVSVILNMILFAVRIISDVIFWLIIAFAAFISFRFFRN